jgi:hypothetical protein
MAEEAGLILDQLTDKHELLPFDPDDPDATQVVAVEHGGWTLEVIVPLLYDDTRIGEVVASAVASEMVFVLCRQDRPLEDDYGTLGLLVVAVPYRDGRYRAVIAHATHALEQSTDEREGLGLVAAIPPGTGPERERRTGLDAILAFYRARPFFSFVIETTSGERFSVRKPDSIAFSPGWDAMILWSNSDRFTEIDTADITQVTQDDREPIEPAPPAGTVAQPPSEGTGPERERPTGVDAIRASYHAHPFRPFLIVTASGGRFPIRRPETIAIPPKASYLILTSQPEGIVRIAVADVAAVREIAPDDPEAIEPAPPAEVAIEDREGLRAELRRLRRRVVDLEGHVHRLERDLGDKIHRLEIDLGDKIHRLEIDLIRSSTRPPS